MTTRRRNLIFLMAASWLSSCGAVEVPEPTWYLLPTPSLAADAAPLAEGVVPAAPVRRRPVVRVGYVQLAHSLPADALVFATSAVRRMPSALHRWLGPLDGMVADAMASSLLRSGRFARVLTAAEPGVGEWTLDLRVSDFHLEASSKDDVRAVVGCWITARDGHGGVVLQREFAATQPVRGGDPEAGVQGLSLALGAVLSEGVDALELASRVAAAAGAQAQHGGRQPATGVAPAPR